MVSTVRLDEPWRRVLWAHLVLLHPSSRSRRPKAIMAPSSALKSDHGSVQQAMKLEPEPSVRLPSQTREAPRHAVTLSSHVDPVPFSGAFRRLFEVLNT